MTDYPISIYTEVHVETTKGVHTYQQSYFRDPQSAYYAVGARFWRAVRLRVVRPMVFKQPAHLLRSQWT